MKKWYYGWEILQLQDWTPTELFNHIRDGLPAYDGKIDRRIYDRNALPRHKKTIEEIADEMRKKFLQCDPPRPPTGLIEHAFKNQTGTPIYPKDGSEVMSFTLPTGKIEACKLLDKIQLFRFKHRDVIEYVQRHGLAMADQETLPITAATDVSEPAPEQTDPEALIRALQIAFESDSEISVKVGTKRPKTYSHDKIGFARVNTKAWSTLIAILKSSDHSYHLGVAHGAKRGRNKPYDANRQILSEISKKFVLFLKEFYNLKLPDKFSLFELKKGDHPGTYVPKFVVSNFNIKDDCNGDLSRDTLIGDIEKLSSRKADLNNRGDENSEKEISRITEELQAKITLAINKKWLGPNRAATYLNPQED